MFERTSQTDMGADAYKNGFPFLNRCAVTEADAAPKKEPTASTMETSALHGFLPETDNLYFIHEERMHPWPSLTDMIQILGGEYIWKQEFENMLILRSLVSGALLILFMAMGLLLLSM